MIAMQYRFVLPADYDMSIIDRRIADKGRFTDGLPGLLFKAYLSSRKGTSQAPESENRYAPFYLWADAPAMNDFLCGPGFAAATQSFGWPSVRTWSVWHAELTTGLDSARFATQEPLPIRAHTRLGALRADETRHARQLVDEQGALAAVAAFDPATWNLVRFQLWADRPPSPSQPDQWLYEVGHVSRG